MVKTLNCCLLFVVSIVFLQGCATIISGKRQDVHVSSEPSGADVCLTGPLGFSDWRFKDKVLVNGNYVQPRSVMAELGMPKEKVCAKTPVVFNISKKNNLILKKIGYEDMLLEFEKEGYKPSVVQIGFDRNGWFFCNHALLIFDVIAYAVDYSNGAFWKIKNPDINAVLEKAQPENVANDLKVKMEEVASREKALTASTSKPIDTTHVIKSDVDELPQFSARPKKNAHAIVIGIEQYRQELPSADFAASDARTMTEYLTKVMGYPEGNVVTLINDRAAKSDFEKYFEKWLPNNVEKDGTVFIYYSGHGAPNPKTGDAYLVPYDGDPAFIDMTGYSLKRLYDAMGKLPTKEIIVALDSCFSGEGGKSVIAKGSRPLVINLENITTPTKNMVVMSASGGDQISSTYAEKGHGLFTYFLLKGIKEEGDINGDGIIEAGELYNYLKPNVERIARKLYNNIQTPQLIAPDKSLEKQRVF